MKMFLGEYQPNITEGSRLALPKKLRDQILGDEVVLSRGFEQCVFIYDKNDWLEESQKQLSGSITEARTRDLKRYMYAGAAEAAIDSQGRIVLPSNLKVYAQLDKETTVIGAGDHIEIWNTSIWEAYLENLSKNLPS
ncbi:division/cell wall cluster transcriptional repressor MraZ [Candidatus Nomurabacteria bacterium]|uniref:Transcriptional regulator MraZ n=1 Tax=candidate division WWE3 bacterium TaxID=2053526 RepID=A0A955E087_UNCKA|nr:division/cell wall cluster transcriptional repressor MraZ [candidate division WWE3 bacterium]MCB9824120.1 division/cell wall cluster transcriptional repressor MraZ [Candidatus Nomurabacteria bacterium]MCB9826909.1 division/cell wall cluster transcriptional repressor MraZ [Candidatus Nomurabacteria bacterium]MCB9828061.1 division/cell wall cluster transcriptional repressor MraZ [Candidatus Nomurabacteria bacterium]HXK52706.1 division/cell wall cluster transcriptional repressor MraZ [bacterium